MTNDDQPGYSGQHLMQGASAAIDRRPDFANRIRELIRSISNRENIGGDDPAVQELLKLIEDAGVPPVPLLNNKGEAPQS
ncbi:hypothetical protein [Jatrophihabitans fulvus]